MNNPPPKGYKILEHGPDDIVPVGALVEIHGAWKPSNRVGKEPSTLRYAIPATDSNDDWTPMPGCGEGGRLPTEKDGERFDLTLFDETYFVSENWKPSNFPPNTSAWRPHKKLKPWNPTEPEKPERREFYRVWIDGIFFSDYDTSADVDYLTRTHPERDKMEVEHLRQVLPGDPTPEAVREAVHMLRTRASMNRVSNKAGTAEWCDFIADKLGGKSDVSN